MKDKLSRLRDLLQSVYDLNFVNDRREHKKFSDDGIDIVYFPNAVDVNVSNKTYQVKWELIKGKISNLWLNDAIDINWLANTTSKYLHSTE